MKSFVRHAVKSFVSAAMIPHTGHAKPANQKPRLQSQCNAARHFTSSLFKLASSRSNSNSSFHRPLSLGWLCGARGSKRSSSKVRSVGVGGSVGVGLPDDI